MNIFLGFDPLLFLGITNVKGEEKNTVSKHLLSKISQYLLIRISELLSIDDLKSINYPDKLFILAQSKIPNLSQQVKIFLEDFKKDFHNNLKHE